MDKKRIKIKLVFENYEKIKKSGIGKAREHQIECLKNNGIEYSLDLKEKDYDILHINTAFLKSKRILKHAKKNGKPIIYHGHSTYEDFQNSFKFSNVIAPLFGRWLEKRYGKADLILTPTPSSKEDISKMLPKAKIVDISNGINTKKWNISKKQVDAFEKKFNLSKDDKVIISSGHPFKRKGIIDFIDLAHKMPEHKFIWFGMMKKSMMGFGVRKKLAKKPSNMITPGYVSGDVYLGAYGRADLFVLCSTCETEGIVTLEALAAKRRVVVRDIKVYKKWMQDGKNCYKFKEDGSNLEAKVKKALATPYSKFAENVKKTVDERTIINVGKKLTNIYNKVLEDKIDELL